MSLVDRVSNVLAGRIDRRGFLTRTAIVGSALSVAPVDYLLHPTTAYAAVCSCAGGSACACGSACCDGYTEFCCSIYGSNACPAGTAVAGWWKADGSGFCAGPRYYMDCNAACGSCGCGASGVCGGSCSGTPCTCANGNCNERGTGCNEFRYGQCNQEIACVGPIVCRLVTCAAPWEIDATCTQTVAVDEATATHDAPCLHSPNGAIDELAASGLCVVVAGWALDPDVDGPILVDLYLNGAYTTTVSASGPAPDGITAHEGHGFTAAARVEPGTYTACTYLINAGFGVGNPLLGCGTVTVGGALASATWYLRNSNTTGIADNVLAYGNPGDIPLIGDWNGDGVDGIGVYRNSVWYLRNSLTTGIADFTVNYGNPLDIPIVGDWNGDGIDGIGVVRNSVWYLRNPLTSGVAETVLAFGNPGDIPIVGDWDGDGIDGIGVVRNDTWYLCNSIKTGVADMVFKFGDPGDIPIVGDWNGDGIDGIGVVRQGIWYLCDNISSLFSDSVFAYGNPSDAPLVGRWVAPTPGQHTPHTPGVGR